MAKRNRGKALKKLPAKGRGECPVFTGNALNYFTNVEQKEMIV